MKIWNSLRKSMMMLGMALFLSMAAIPAMDAYAAVQQTQVQEESQAADAVASQDGGFELLIMGGGLLIILFAVIAAVATISSVFGLAAVIGDEEE